MDDTNYRTWKSKIQDILCVKELTEPIENNNIVLVRMKDKEKNGRNLIDGFVDSFNNGLGIVYGLVIV